MKTVRNKVAIICGAVITSISIVILIISGYFHIVWMSSLAWALLGVGVGFLIDGIFISKTSVYEVDQTWGLQRIFRTRVEKNQESDPLLITKNISTLDCIAFGLSSFRSNHTNDVLNRLNHGMNMRLLVMDPNSEFAKKRSIEEGSAEETIPMSIKNLSLWVDNLNAHSTTGKVEIRYYDCMTLDFYWRIDDIIYFGPYMLDIQSQQTVTYKCVSGGKLFEIYTDYFEALWNKFAPSP